MKQMKKTMMAIISGLLLLTVAIISCKKDSNPAPVTPAPTITDFTPATGTTGTTVTITGTNFSGTTAVSFGGTAAASFSLVSTSSITAVVGAGATGDVTVVTGGGQATKSGFTFTAPIGPVDGYSSSDEVESADLIAQWPFNGNLTERLHTSAPVLTGGTQTFVTGKIGQAVHLDAGWLTYGPDATDASTDNTTFGSSDVLQNGFTLTLWAQVPDTGLLTNLFQLSSPNIPNWPILGLSYRKHADNSFDMDFGLGNVDGTGPHISYASLFQEPAHIDSLDWQFLAITYDATAKSVSYYANGILRTTKDLAGIFPDITASLLMIAPNYATIGTFEGQNRTPGDVTNSIPGFMADGITGNIDDIRFFKKTLTQLKITDLYTLGNQGR